MKTLVHTAGSRGHADHGWLDTRFTFSFAEYYDPSRVHFGLLRVLNDDLIAGGGGFGRHPHDNMEIVTVVLEGQLEHKDSMGHTMVLAADEVQVMSAGTGIFHSEYNHTPDIPVRLLQIWVFPDRKNLTPRYDQKGFNPAGRMNTWQALVSPDAEGALRISQQARFSRITLEKGKTVQNDMNGDDHGAYVFMIGGEAEVAGRTLGPRDGIGVTETPGFELTATVTAEILVIEVPMH